MLYLLCLVLVRINLVRIGHLTIYHVWCAERGKYVLRDNKFDNAADTSELALDLFVQCAVTHSHENMYCLCLTHQSHRRFCILDQELIPSACKCGYDSKQLTRWSVLVVDMSGGHKWGSDDAICNAVTREASERHTTRHPRKTSHFRTAKRTEQIKGKFDLYCLTRSNEVRVGQLESPTGQFNSERHWWWRRRPARRRQFVPGGHHSTTHVPYQRHRHHFFWLVALEVDKFTTVRLGYYPETKKIRKTFNFKWALVLFVVSATLIGAIDEAALSFEVTFSSVVGSLKRAIPDATRCAR